ncbi:MAG: hypothetical protein ACOC9B_06510 [Chloroflexota bacterium]
MSAADVVFRVWDAYTSGWGLWVSIGMYVWLAACTVVIARRNHAALWWLGPVPLGNFALMCVLGKRPAGYFWVLLVATIALAIGVTMQLAVWTLFWLVLWAIAWTVVWTGIARESGKPAVLGILMLVPVVNLALLGVLAFGE